MKFHRGKGKVVRKGQSEACPQVASVWDVRRLLIADFELDAQGSSVMMGSRNQVTVGIKNVSSAPKFLRHSGKIHSLASAT